MKSKLLITVLIIVLLVVCYLLGTDYMEQRQEREELTFQITDVRQTLAQIPKPPQYLEYRLAAAQASLAAKQNEFPSAINSTQIIDAILRLANDCEIKVVALASEPWSAEEVGEHDYYVLRLNLGVEGSFFRVLTFVTELETGQFNTLIMENLRAEAQTVLQGDTPITANLDLAIYAQSPTSD